MTYEVRERSKAASLLDKARREARREARQSLTKTDYLVICYVLFFTIPLILCLYFN